MNKKLMSHFPNVIARVKRVKFHSKRVKNDLLELTNPYFEVRIVFYTFRIKFENRAFFYCNLTLNFRRKRYL